MQRKKSIAPPGAKDNLLAFVNFAVRASNPIEPRKNFVAKAVAATTLESLPDETCKFCAKPFTTALSFQKFCSLRCGNKFRNATRYAKRDELPDKICIQCARLFDPVRANHIKFCSRKCARDFHNGVRSRSGAKERAGLICVDCSAPIAGAATAQRKLCSACKRAHRLANCKRNRERTKAGTNGRRGRNQFTARAREG